MTGNFRIRIRSLGLVSVGMLAFAAACGGSCSRARRRREFVDGHVHLMPMQLGERAARNAAPSAHLSYFGGKVVQNAQVIQVIYGAGTYAGGVNSGTPSLASFYGGVLNSPYVDWLSEYNTSSPTQHIGRGSFSTKIQITPSSTRDGSTISDASIKAEINAQISARHLPTPSNNTIYMVNFPRGKSITQGSSASCVGGGFCAYHGTFKRGSQDVFYGVLPDMSPGSGCDVGCGGNPVAFDNQTSVASHELIETITDPEVGLATVVGPPLAWYDPNNGEIGDICNALQGTITGGDGRSALQGTITGGDGRSYTVQTEWSNQANACIVHK